MMDNRSKFIVWKKVSCLRPAFKESLNKDMKEIEILYYNLIYFKS